MGVVEGELIKVEIEIRVPRGASEDEVEQWLRYALLQTGGINQSNPLYHEHPEAWGPFALSWESMRVTGRKEKFDVEKLEGGGERYRVRYWRDRICAKSDPEPA